MPAGRAGQETKWLIEYVRFPDDGPSLRRMVGPSRLQERRAGAVLPDFGDPRLPIDGRAREAGVRVVPGSIAMPQPRVAPSARARHLGRADRRRALPDEPTDGGERAGGDAVGR